MSPWDVRGMATGPAIILAMGIVSGTLRAQDLTALVSTCGAPSDAHMAWCEEAALAVQAAQGALGLSASGGIDLPGAASTLGWRTKGSPRFALSLRGSVTRSPLPAMNSVGNLPTGKATANLPSLHASGTLGLFDGFSLGPTVGGFGSLDLSLAGHWVGKPGAGGFRKSASGWGVGARLGILRESFSLPGLSVSGFRRFLGSHALWSLAEGDPAEATFDLEVSSLRAMVGKDLWGIGLYGGFGWDRYSGSTDLAIRDPEGGETGSIGNGEIRSHRRIAFLGASRTFLTFQISGEIGWGGGFSPSFSTSSAPRAGDFDPSTPSYFGSVGFRLTF